MSNPKEPPPNSSGLPLIAWQGAARSLGLPTGFPHSVAPPKRWIGSHCRWGSDTGTIIGQVFTGSEAVDEPMEGVWLYLLWLDPDSPSRQWLVADWAEEEDLEPLQASTPSTSEVDR